jgi:ankyrin repeat protein
MLALKYAGGPKDSAIAGLLMSHGADSDLTSDEGTTTLMVAASNRNNIDIVRGLLDKGADPNQVNSAGKTALMAASGSEGNTAMVELLLNRGSDVNLADEDGMTALINAAWGRNNAATIRLLLERGANPDAKANNRWWDKDKFTALMWAASLPPTGGEVSNVEALLAAGVDLHARSEKGRTALMLAIRGGNIETAQALLRRDAKVDDEDMVAKTPLNYAEEYSASEVTRADMIRILKKAGAK